MLRHHDGGKVTLEAYTGTIYESEGISFVSNEISASAICPCRMQRKKRHWRSYGDCCKSIGQVRWEKRVNGSIRKVVICKQKGAVQSLQMMRSLREEVTGQPNVDGPALSITIDQLQTYKMLLVTELYNAGHLDSCFVFCIEKSDFWPNYWRYVLDKNERMLRKREWNGFVSDYYRNRPNFERRRSTEIEKKYRIGRFGVWERQMCLHCSRREEFESQFKVCSVCEMAKYCSRGCQKRHWSTHKANCKRGNFVVVERQQIPDMAVLFKDNSITSWI